MKNKKHGLKLSKYSLKATYFFNIEGGLTLRIFLISKWQLWTFSMGKINFGQNAYFCLKMIFRPCYFHFLPHFARLFT